MPLESAPGFMDSVTRAVEYGKANLSKPEISNSDLYLITNSGCETQERLCLVEEARHKYNNLRNPNGETGEVPLSPPKVSVVIPVYSAESTRETLKLIGSLLENKDAPTTEIIAVVNGNESEDDLKNLEIAGILEEIGLKVLYKNNSSTDKNRNIFRARQEGLEATEGEHILNVDADCVVSKQWIRNLSAQLEESTFAYGPVVMKKTSNLTAEKMMMTVSVIAKAGKVFTGLLPYQGGNHAFNKEDVLAITAKPYELIEMNESELPVKLSEIVEKNLSIGFVSNAGIITPFGYAEHADSSWELIVSYFSNAISRNTHHLREKQIRKREQGKE